TITAFESDTYGSPGVGRGGTVGPMPYVYPVEYKTKHMGVRLNTGGARAMRAPGHPQSCYLTDCALDDFAAKIGMDPMQVRLKNLPANDADAIRTAPTSFLAIRGTLYTREIDIAARLSKWK